MSVKTLNSAPTLHTLRPVSPARTYSIAPLTTPAIGESLYSTPDELEAFLEGENPLGCIRGVMWVMGFNAAVFLLGIMIWQASKLLL